MMQPAVPNHSSERRLTPTEELHWAMAAHWGAILASAVAMAFLAPLGILLFMGARSDFVKRHATESLNFQLTFLIYLAAAFVLTLLTLGVALFALIPLFAIAAVLALIAIVLATLAASRGEDYRYPLTFRFVR